jgi:hypothetical protein
MCTWKPDKSKLIKEIIKDDFICREDAIKFEAEEITKFIDDEKNENYNIPNIGFHTCNTVIVKDDEKLIRVSTNDPRYVSGELTAYNKGMITVKDANGNCFRTSVETPDYKAGKLIPALDNKGKITVRLRNGTCINVSTNDTRYTSGELIAASVGFVTVFDINGNTFRVSVDDPRYVNGELKHISVGHKNAAVSKKLKNTVGVIDENGNNIRISIDDPRYTSGKLQHWSKNKNTDTVPVRDVKTGKCFRVLKTDPRYISGELIHIAKKY